MRYREGVGSERDIERGWGARDIYRESGERERYREGMGSERDIERGWGAREI